MANPILDNGHASLQSIYDEYTVTKADGNISRAEGRHPVGTRARLEDGRVFYYASNSTTALTAGSLVVQSGFQVANAHDKVVLTDSSANFAAGKRRMVLQESDLDTNDIIENRYKDGYMCFENAAGAGGTYYKIKHHDAFDASGSATDGQITLFDEIKVAAAATDEITFYLNKYDRIVTSTTAEEELAVGVAPIAVTASGALATDVTTAASSIDTSFFWAQTWGPCAVEVDGTATILGMAVMSANTADRVEQAALIQGAHTSNATTLDVTGFDRPIIGVAMNDQAVASAGDFVMVDLRISQ